MRRVHACVFVLFSLAVCGMLLVGWRICGLDLINAEHGVGRGLGILGAAFMVVLMVYSARKRIPALRFIGSVKMWFRIHMILGVAGPVCVLYHARFGIGSLNSAVALFAMLAIAASGVIGRYIYGKVYCGLDGRRATLLELRDNLRVRTEQVTTQYSLIPEVSEELCTLAEQVITTSFSLSTSIKQMISTEWRSTYMQWKIALRAKKCLKRSIVGNEETSAAQRKLRRQLRKDIRRFLRQVVIVAQFSFFERIFALWQIMHIPSVWIFGLVVLVHVIAVSLY
jgi:hypothetical protein